jgi:hypothetical protein
MAGKLEIKNANGNVFTLENPDTLTSDQSLSVDNIPTQDNTYTKAEIDNKPTGRKNLVINGGFDVWQRGTSFTDTVIWTRYTADRFNIANSGANSVVSRSNLVPDNKGFKHSLQYSGNSSDAFLLQYVEGSNVVSGRTATFSFWLNGTIDDLAPTLGYIYDGSYHSITSETVTLVETVGTWNRYAKTHTFAAGDYNPIVRIDFKEGVSSTIQTTGWQLELGSVATPFEHRSYGEELALCQRYYQKYNSRYNLSNYHPDYRTISMPFPVTMRTTPSTSVLSSTHTVTTANQNSNTGYTGYVAMSHNSTTFVYIDDIRFDAEL